MSGQITEDYLGSDSSYPSGSDYRDGVDRFQHGGTIKRLGLKRRPRVAVNNEEKTQGGVSSSQWYSAESLSPSTGDTRLLGMSSAIRGRPPLPPPYGSSSEGKPSRHEGPAAPLRSSEQKPQPAARSFALQRPSSVVEKTQKQEVANPPQPQPRRRLASFGGVSSPGSPSPFTGLSAYNQNSDGNRPAGAGGEVHVHLGSSQGGRGSTGSLKLSPQSSGGSTPVASAGPTHLQHVRDQMVVALQRLKELEEQVKVIPVLHVKISVLREEKRQLISQLGNRTDHGEDHRAIRTRGHDADRSDTVNQVNADEGLEGTSRSDSADVGKFKQLTEEMQALERIIKGRPLQTWHGIGRGAPENTSSKPSQENKSVSTDRVETRSVATEASDVHLGIHRRSDAELDAQRLTIGALKERICHLEAEAKESALRAEMSRLKLELLAAGARSRADKASWARPSTASAAVEATVPTASRGVGNHAELRDAGTGRTVEARSVGVSCRGPALEDVGAGPDVPMSRWEVRERPETTEKGAGSHVFTNARGVWTEIESRDAETNTEVPIETQKGEIRFNSVACGDCSVDAMLREAKEVVSQGVATDRVKGTDLGIMASPRTASQRTNTESSSVSRFTSTGNAFSTDSSTNTAVSTRDRHTNTPQALTRTVAVGNQVNGVKCAPTTCTVGVGTTHQTVNTFNQTPGTVPRVTRDIGVGFTNVKENFLVGLKTQNMASGPSRLPDPFRTRSVGVGEGRIWDLSVSSGHPGPTVRQPPPSQWDPGLNHYIEKMQRLLGDHGDLLAHKAARRWDEFDPGNGSGGGGDPKPPRDHGAAAPRGTEVHPVDAQPPVGRETQSQLSDSAQCNKASPDFCPQGGGESEVRRMIQMLEQQASSALQDRSTDASMLRSVTKKQRGDRSCSSNRKSMKFLRVTTGLEPVPSFEFFACENSEEVERRGNKKSGREASQDGAPARKGKSGANRGSKGFARSPSQQRSKVSERMLSACQALKTHLIDYAALSGRELHDCLQTIQQEWFSVSSQKSAAPDAVDDYLSAFRAISPSVLQRVANMADGNGNTALHYSVSHSNFGIVKKLLDAEVCNVNQQNRAGYTPIMLAALAAVESPEDMRVVEELFAKGDVNARASQAGQTALMLAVSHGRMEMVRALLARGAYVNLRDDEGSTALMCAGEHGHADIVRLLLAQPGCDATLTDSDESTALSVALEAGHHDIAVLLYAHSNFSKGQTGTAAHHGGRTSSSSSSPAAAAGGRNMFE